MRAERAHGEPVDERVGRAIARYNLLDIDRVISGTASYTLAGVVLPIQRAWRPYVDRLFFSDGRSKTEEIERLLEELPSLGERGAETLVNFVGARLEEVFGPAFWVVYQLRGDAFDPAFLGGDVQAQPLSGENAQIITRVLDKRIGPIVLDSRGRSGESPAIALSIRAGLDGIEPVLVIPLRPHGALDALLCVGPKLSGDVYTPTDLSLLASVAHHASQELALRRAAVALHREHQ